jgi:hypothetical protein
VVRLHRVNLTRQQLDRIPENERRLLVLIAHVGNELNVFAKLFHFAAGSASEEGVLGQAENAQALVLARTLTGKIYEFWMLLQSSFFGPALSKEYEPQLDEEARAALQALKRYFGRDNLIDTVRNKFAFHFSPDQIDAGYNSIVENDPLQIYLAKENVNTLYAFADTIVGRAMLEAIRPGDHQGAFDALIDQTSAAVGNINTVIGALMIVCFKRYVGDSLYALGADIIEIEGAPDSQKIEIPFFIEVTQNEDA